MTWNLAGEYLDVLLAVVLILKLCRLNLYSKYAAFLIFIAFDSFESLVYIAIRLLWNHGFRLDYRILWMFIRAAVWITTICMVYALLTGILQQLPGIYRFSIRFLNIVFGLSGLVALITLRPEFRAANFSANSNWIERSTVAVIDLDRAFCFAELLTLLAILTFVLFFPVQVPRNRAVFSAGLSIYLFLRIGSLLERTYLPAAYAAMPFDLLPFVMAACLIYWISNIGKLGEETKATLGRAWQAVPRDHLVRQLEAMNAALLRSREQA